MATNYLLAGRPTDSYFQARWATREEYSQDELIKKDNTAFLTASSFQGKIQSI